MHVCFCDLIILTALMMCQLYFFSAVELFNLGDGETSIAERLPNNAINHVQNSAIVIPSAKAPTSSLVPEDGTIALLDVSADMPHDQHRMIENINSLISEVVIFMFFCYYYLNL